MLNRAEVGILNNIAIPYVPISIFFDMLLTLVSLQGAVTLRRYLTIGEDIPLSATLVPTEVYFLAAVIWYVMFYIAPIYDPEHHRHLWQEIRETSSTCVIAMFMFAGALYFSYRDVSRLLIIYFYIFNIIGLLGWRVVYYAIMSLYGKPRKVLIYGQQKTAKRIENFIANNQWTRLTVTNVLNETTAPQRVLNYITTHDVEDVIIALPSHAHQGIHQLIGRLQLQGVQVRVVSDYYTLTLSRAEAENFGGVPLMTMQAPIMTTYQRFIKRIFDLIVGSMLLILLLPVLAGITLAIMLTDGGDVIFRQKRVGENLKPFYMYKFRTMVRNADSQVETIVGEDGKETFVKSPDDPRIIAIGHFLRRTSLDELPQLVNVLKGEMSLVGPRPEMPWLVSQYDMWQLRRFSVPQGITGWWQVNGRSERPMHHNTEDDIYYIQNFSLLLDVIILLRTIPTIISGRGAY